MQSDFTLAKSSILNPRAPLSCQSPAHSFIPYLPPSLHCMISNILHPHSPPNYLLLRLPQHQQTTNGSPILPNHAISFPRSPPLGPRQGIPVPLFPPALPTRSCWIVHNKPVLELTQTPKMVKLRRVLASRRQGESTIAFCVAGLVHRCHG